MGDPPTRGCKEKPNDNDGPEDNCGLPQIVHDRIVCLGAVTSDPFCMRFCCLRLWLGCRPGCARIRTRAASGPPTRRTPDGGVTARCPGEGAVTGCHVTAPRFVAAVWPRSGSLVAGVLVVGDLAVVGCGAVQLSCWASRF